LMLSPFGCYTCPPIQVLHRAKILYPRLYVS
jgi:hypothetical protein